MTSLSFDLAAHLHGFTADRLPDRILHHARRYMLDYLGCTAFGSGQPWSVIARQDAILNGLGAGNCSLIGAPERLGIQAAAFANGSAGHAFEIDDVHDETISHPGAVIYATAMAVGQAVNAPAGTLLAAIAAGYEAIGRVGLATGPWAHMSAGFHPTSTFGVFGAAASAAQLLELDPTRINHALGLAASMASGIVEFSQSGGQPKRIHAGLAAASGIRAAYLAKNGMEGPASSLDGRYGFCRTFSPEPKVEMLTAELGIRYMLDEVTVKPYPSCSDVHSLIECAQVIASEGVRPEDIAAIAAVAPSKVVNQNLIDGSGSVMAAQYSAGFQIAIGLTRDPTDPTIYTPELLADPVLAGLQSMVSVTSSAEYDAVYAWKIPGSLHVTLKDGREFKHAVEAAKGTPHRPFSDVDIETKFRKMTSALLSAADQDRVIDSVWGLADGNQHALDQIFNPFARFQEDLA